MRNLVLFKYCSWVSSHEGYTLILSMGIHVYVPSFQNKHAPTNFRTSHYSTSTIPQVSSHPAFVIARTERIGTLGSLLSPGCHDQRSSGLVLFFILIGTFLHPSVDSIVVTHPSRGRRYNRPGWMTTVVGLS